MTTGNFDGDLAKIAIGDWIVEAVTEDLSIKRALYDRVIPHRAPGAIVSTNTSGIPLAQIAEGFDPELRRHFLGTHFFNPPRYLHLVELIPGPATRLDILSFISGFLRPPSWQRRFVPCKDTPNFIGNRIGAFFGAAVQRLTVEHDLTIEEVDALTGPLIGLPKSASYRLLDIIGPDVWEHVTKNLYEAVLNDPFREQFQLAPFVAEMIRRGWLGDKRGRLLQAGRQGPRNALDRKIPRIPSRRQAPLRFSRNRAQNRAARRTPESSRRARRQGGPLYLAADQRALPVCCADGARNLRAHRRDRPRHALGLRQRARLRTAGRSASSRRLAALRSKAGNCRRESSGCWGSRNRA